ncbi:MAG: cytochrome c maturation protein CcmE [Rickettsiales bacterium]|jgi:cytochrome c-type biogenesis protein CcmE|nr:cytochrome c maturation protein CcmE [Rickettsiales bacterium]
MNNYKKFAYKKRIAFILTVISFSIFAVFVIIKDFQNNLSFFYSPSDIANYNNLNSKLKSKLESKFFKIRVGGLVKEGSFNKKDNQNIAFIITDLKNEIAINYQGILPDLFREKQGVVAVGFFDLEKKVFNATQLLIKHDENYIPPEVAKIIAK